MNDGSSLAITDLTGRNVMTIALSGNETTFQTAGMSKGIYLCNILSGDKVISTRKLVVE